jgi:hypothetical protein
MSLNACNYFMESLNDYDGDTRNRRHKGKHSYKYKEKLRIMYIKQKKELQRDEQKSNPLIKFHNDILINERQSTKNQEGYTDL